ncbi:MAG: universal stress protein [Thermodesulfovibrionales bacterium]|nr:universal stress protein [Thermodesulfovibrionales bacterium]
MSRILLALSLNERYNSLVSYSIWLAKNLGEGANIELLTVQDYSLTPPSYLTPYLEEERMRYSKILEKISLDIKKYGIDASYTVASGRLVETFKKAICSLKIDFLVLGYKSHILRMSSSENLVRSINIPMLVCRGQKASAINSFDEIHIKNVMCLIDFSENSIRAFDGMKMLLSNIKDSVNITILNVISSLKVDEMFRNIPSDDPNRRIEYCENLTKERLQGLRQFSSQGFSLQFICKIGLPYKIINEVAREMDVDMIFMGAKGVSQTEGFRIGSLTESILKTSPCPVVVIT